MQVLDGLDVVLHLVLGCSLDEIGERQSPVVFLLKLFDQAHDLVRLALLPEDGAKKIERLLEVWLVEKSLLETGFGLGEVSFEQKGVKPDTVEKFRVLSVKLKGLKPLDLLLFLLNLFVFQMGLSIDMNQRTQACPSLYVVGIRLD